MEKKYWPARRCITALTDRPDVKATPAPALHLSWRLAKNITELGSQDRLAAVGLAEGGVRHYYSRKADSFFIADFDADTVRWPKTAVTIYF